MQTRTISIFGKKKIRVDSCEMICLDDIHRVAGFSKHMRPRDWLRNPNVPREISRIIARNTKKSGPFTKDEIKSVWKMDKAGETWADVNMAVGYAGALSPELAVEIRDVFIRYKSGDATLADEILEKASPKDNEWVAYRALGRIKRHEFTATLQEHGVKGYGYAHCTDAIYEPLFDAKAKALKAARQIGPNANLRDRFNTDELIKVAFAESLSRQRIEEEDSQGNKSCRTATLRSASFVRQAIENERRDRQKPLV